MVVPAVFPYAARGIYLCHAVSRPAMPLLGYSRMMVNGGWDSALRRTMQARHYSKKVHEHFFNPKNAGAFDLSDPEVNAKVGTAVVGKAACGDVIKLQVMVEDGKIRDARFKTFGCGSAIASSSYATELIKGKSCADALKLRNTDIAAELNLPPVKVHCSLLAEDAVKHAIRDYQKKQEKAAAASASSPPIQLPPSSGTEGTASSPAE
ncbi:iron-sulfur cluster protein iscu [Cystoisospora suis]|uniref:Iron-sulfur cluster protein iscu n=1 Tax=Cystoisospora suis TaxID=483139 RepID=A0A2C6KNJ7_9APIC|nr:iron-sulfur cluster protein iscu [Cystoisospora suis]